MGIEVRGDSGVCGGIIPSQMNANRVAMNALHGTNLSSFAHSAVRIIF
jgi:hypothetical protein